jgi:hypothetical protein
MSPSNPPSGVPSRSSLEQLTTEPSSQVPCANGQPPFSADWAIFEPPACSKARKSEPFVTDWQIPVDLSEAVRAVDLQYAVKPDRPRFLEPGWGDQFKAALADELVAVRWDVTVPLAVMLTGILLALRLIVP